MADNVEALAMAGVIPIPGANALFLDPTIMLSSSYSHYRIDPSLYYVHPMTSPIAPLVEDCHTPQKRKRNRTKKKKYVPNVKEVVAEDRHQKIRPYIENAFKAFASNTNIAVQSSRLQPLTDRLKVDNVDFVKLSTMLQAPLYDITIQDAFEEQCQGGQTFEVHDGKDQVRFPLYGTMVSNKSTEDIVAKCVGCTYVLPRHSRFYMSDIAEINQLIPEVQDNGYKLLILDPPWENKSVCRKSPYPALPNRHLFRLPLKHLTHSEGAILGIWLTNREKIYQFVYDELFPAWHVTPICSWHWLKVTQDGEMLSKLEMMHHKPYETFLIGHVKGRSSASNENLKESFVGDFSNKLPPNNLVIVGVPGEHSRKPPLGMLLAKLISSSEHPRALELFARDVHANWTSWGNEPLHFQHVQYFARRNP